ncbi:MAG: hypothetical protein HC812_19345 [Leptolyngbya sp. RL_3_1]|nr:hypothetical protein [Leptolyngbya sp. RL_3_1]
MKLRDVVNELLIDPRKFTGYALNPDVDRGRDKAVLFQEYLGFTRDNYQDLMRQIEDQAMAADAIPKEYNEHGRRYRVDLLIKGVRPNQQEIVRTGWIVKPGDDVARLVTLYIPRRK